ncbi:LamG-like jellyroll fold domain-containing protein [Dactylosporangium sp. AC04546]|uniref:LamG-like jellyroll fold domain-containing protein n=1 Tax=Dactylosporangium sp. AC04546 TaxID=2862460 RepID=UPI001EE04E36|nr:LamG-like jellyroll fold domain-containing protein [Dactylosporangium sp. AC04546]WVK81402.1 LamG-like jellyroll fold domain-containing protein [Dactylosporangium sp. AC04546]
MTDADQVPQSGQVGRRAVLLAAAAAPAAGAAATLLGAAPAAAGTAGTPGTDPVVPRFTIAVLPDTQYLFDEDSSQPEPLRQTFEYLVRERDETNIVFMAHLGDVTEHGSEHEIALASDTFRRLDGRMSYSVLAGNHDIRSSTDDQRGDSAYLRAFGPARYAKMPTFGGASPDGYNSYHVLRAGGRQWLVLALDWRVSEAGLRWAQGVLDGHRTLPVILTTHELAYAEDDGEAHLSGWGQQLWDRFVKRNDQIFLTLNGHFWPPGRTVLRNDAGHDVHVHITNYQDRYYGGAGMIRLYHFDLARDVIDVETFAPWFLNRDPRKRNALEAETVELTGPADRFSLAVGFEARFAGFAPVTPPPPRPVNAVVGRSTVAYWRFDAAGLPSAGTAGAPVADGTVVKDLTGKGNDLTARRLHDSAAGALTWSPEHHTRQPAHASLRFDGGKSPDRGAILEARAGAPINSLRFEQGYTIEAFVKLPAPFEGDHAWMGILSWEGRSGDAGKSSGWSPDEPTCSLNLSPERFLQYVVYPTDRDADPTSWSHALPVGRWMHLAVVNDARRTVVYVDGSPIVRNPTQPSKGISTLGKPFVIGATQFGEQFGQGFYGWIGDVRISSAPLAPRDFLAPA